MTARYSKLEQVLGEKDLLIVELNSEIRELDDYVRKLTSEVTKL